MAPRKRARQLKMTTQALLDFDLGESSSDSDFCIDDFASDGSKDDCDDGDSNSSSSENSSSEEEEDGSEVNSDDSTQQLKQLLSEDVDVADTQVSNGGEDLEVMLRQLDNKNELTPQVPTKPICCVCLGDRSDDSNEIVECDGCGVSVHEGCYGVSDNTSISSTNSTCSTEPWFCEACRAGVSEPICELCPNKGGIYKETDVGKWVHLVCALYVPGVAFGEVDQLSLVTLFEMQYSKWGAKVCSLCENSRFARTGVCIGCDAGMCKTYFHVTCAQAAGFLTEAHHDEADAADPFYAHCKVHSEKELIKKRKRNFHTFRLNMEQKRKEKLLLKHEDPCPAQMRIQRKLLKYQSKYKIQKQRRADPWVPTQKMSRLLTTSASACKRLLTKAAIMAVDVELLERQEAQIAALTDIRKKWHIAPAFSVEFVGYYLDRISRSKELKQQLGEMMSQNSCLSKEQDVLRRDYDIQLEKNRSLKGKYEELVNAITQIHKQLTALCPNKTLSNPLNVDRSQVVGPAKTSPLPSRPISVPTAAALKMGVGFPLSHLGSPGCKADSTRLLSTHAINSSAAPVSTTTTGTSPASTAPLLGVQTFECGICKLRTDQHLLAKCDTCQLHYHLGCLNPPLTRLPKKSKLYGWQCSECDKSDESDAVAELPKGPRKSRTRFNKDGTIVPATKRSHQAEETAVKETRVLSSKRRSTEAPSTSSPSKKAANKTSSSSADPPKESKEPATEGTMATAAKKSKLSHSSPQQSNESVGTLSNVTPTQLKITNGARPSQNPPTNATISTDEPLLLVLSQTSALRLAANPAQGSDADPLALPAGNNTMTSSLDESSELSKQARKQKRKDKHRSKHNPSSDIEKSPSKEHKRKRKKKLHDIEHPSESSANIPKIKIKFKTLPLPGEVTPEAQFFYVPADMVRSAEEASRPTSVETIEDTIAPTVVEDPVVVATPAKATVATPRKTPEPALNSTTKATVQTRKTSPRKMSQRSSAGGRPKASPNSLPAIPQTLTCCVCHVSGVQTNIVTCDECGKHYHFTCLDPPLKKSPKIRGYSWHCADCDPTDEEK